MKERPCDAIPMMYWKGKTIWAKTRSVAARGCSAVRKVGYKDEQGILRGDGTVLYLDYGGSYMSVYVCQNVQNCALKRVTSIVCKTYLNLKIKKTKQNKVGL